MKIEMSAKHLEELGCVVIEAECAIRAEWRKSKEHFALYGTEYWRVCAERDFNQMMRTIRIRKALRKARGF